MGVLLLRKQPNFFHPKQREKESKEIQWHPACCVEVSLLLDEAPVSLLRRSSSCPLASMPTMPFRSSFMRCEERKKARRKKNPRIQFMESPGAWMALSIFTSTSQAPTVIRRFSNSIILMLRLELALGPTPDNGDGDAEPAILRLKSDTRLAKKLPNFSNRLLGFFSDHFFLPYRRRSDTLAGD